MTRDDAEVVVIGVSFAVLIPTLWAIFAWDERRMTAAQKARAWLPATRGTVIASPLFFPLWLVGLPLHFVRTRRSLGGVGLAFGWFVAVYALLAIVQLAVGLALGVDLG